MLRLIPTPTPTVLPEQPKTCSTIPALAPQNVCGRMGHRRLLANVRIVAGGFMTSMGALPGRDRTGPPPQRGVAYLRKGLARHARAHVLGLTDVQIGLVTPMTLMSSYRASDHPGSDSRQMSRCTPRWRGSERRPGM